MEQPFSHVDADGKLSMVDVSAKALTRREARASCSVVTQLDVEHLGLGANEFDVIFAARLAGVLAAKQTAALIPLCHPLALDDIHVDVVASEHGAQIVSSVVTVQRTGVEMEALTACAVAALSLVNALVHDDPSARIDDLVLLRKAGGSSGEWGRQVAPLN